LNRAQRQERRNAVRQKAADVTYYTGKTRGRPAAIEVENTRTTAGSVAHEDFGSAAGDAGVVAKRPKLATEMMRANTGLHAAVRFSPS